MKDIYVYLRELSWPPEGRGGDDLRTVTYNTMDAAANEIIRLRTALAVTTSDLTETRRRHTELLNHIEQGWTA
jgi:hypothetical protein